MTIPVLTTTLVAAAAALGIRNWHLTRLERERANARVEALAAALDGGGDPAREEGAAERSASGGLALFAPETATRRGLPFPALVGALGVMGLVALLVAVAASRPARPRAAAVPSASPALELLSTQHVLDDQTLVITGLVRNGSPASTPALTVVVSAIAHDGQLAGRASSPLDPPVLAPGKETAFRVAVTGVSDLARYRLRFSSGNTVVPHLDRRSEVARTAMADTEDRN